MYAQAVEWNDAVLMLQFKVNLSQAIQNELARRPTPASLESLIFEAIDIDNKLIKGPRERRHINNNNTITRSPPSPMDIDPKPNQSSRISKEERDGCNQNRSCFYCGDSTHFKRDCPKINGGHAVNTFVLNTVTVFQIPPAQV
ncbi:putative secondary metabolism biosynthetic enzyme [Mucor velutinosus]|uniref:Secondary metabolism biosynthetic enzyme n=1 Tax=Mucor velutinosus TaxID=708070 RepID=A0AAN7HZV8_9FUNG|nr:putative secondary metabolism biosynthetic enzyme [Mucor velutinosus]